MAVPAIAPVAPAEPERPIAAFDAVIATRDEPAPLRDTVLAPAEPFELLEPAVAADVSSAPVATTASDDRTASAASTWLADSFAKLQSAETAAAAVSTAPVVETNSPQPTAAPQRAAASTIASAPVDPAAPRPASFAAPQAPAPTASAAAAVAQAAAPTEPTPRAAQPQAAPRAAEAKAATAPQNPTVPQAAPTAPRVDAAAGRPQTRPAGERPRTERIEPLTGPIPASSAPGVDEFEAAARLFSFTGETPVQNADAVADAQPEEGTHSAARASSPRRRTRIKRVATASFSIGVFGIVGLMAVGMTTPAEAVAAMNGTEPVLAVMAPADSDVPVIDEAEIQAYVAPGDVQSDTLQRTENYATTTTAQLASEAGIRNFSNLFHNNPNSNIQWPFAVGVTMSYGFGMRSGRMHEGIDFTPGNGAPVQAIADGTVRVASEAGGAYGVHVIIDHIVDGQLVSSHYAHMQYGSLKVTAGQRVTVGTVIGRTGNTGRSYGAHTHFEILKNGTTAIDPWPWLQEYTDGTHTVG